MLDELRGVSFADQDFQQLQLGLDVLVLVVFHRQGRAIFLLHVSVEREHRYLSVKRKVMVSDDPLPPVLFLFTCRFAWRTGPRIRASSFGVFSFPLELPGAAPPVPVCVFVKEGGRSEAHSVPHNQYCKRFSTDKCNSIQWARSVPDVLYSSFSFTWCKGQYKNICKDAFCALSGANLTEQLLFCLYRLNLHQFLRRCQLTTSRLVLLCVRTKCKFYRDLFQSHTATFYVVRYFLPILFYNLQLQSKAFVHCSSHQHGEF